jgi:hypothetical protein
LRSHEIDNVKSVDSAYYCQHTFFRADLLSHPVGPIFTGDTPFRGPLQFKGKLTLVTRDNGVEFVRFHAFSSQWQVLTSLDSIGSQLFGQPVGYPSQMEVFYDKCVAQAIQHHCAQHL